MQASNQFIGFFGFKNAGICSAMGIELTPRKSADFHFTIVHGLGDDLIVFGWMVVDVEVSGHGILQSYSHPKGRR